MVERLLEGKTSSERFQTTFEGGQAQNGLFYELVHAVFAADFLFGQRGFEQGVVLRQGVAFGFVVPEVVGDAGKFEVMAFHAVMEEAGDELALRQVVQRGDGPHVAVGVAAGALVLVNDDDLTYAKARLGATGTKTALSHLSGLAEPLARALVWSMLWNCVRDAKLKVQNYLDAAALHSPKETEPAILATVLQQLQMAVENYLPDSTREDARRAEAARAWRGLDVSEPGSDLQRIWARHALALSAADPDSVERTRGLLDGDVTGLVVDPEMRWQSWMALAALGRASAEDLDAELERDRTKTGVAHHMAALTARPDDVAKQEAYRRLRTPGELSNEHCLAYIDGLRTPLGVETFADLNSSYFDDLEQIWQEFPIEMAQRLVVGLFPDGDVAEIADRWLASHQSATGGLTRMVKERRDAASRAETARDFNN